MGFLPIDVAGAKALVRYRPSWANWIEMVVWREHSSIDEPPVEEELKGALGTWKGEQQELRVHHGSPGPRDSKVA